jgi:hypothetical protein
MYWLKIDGPSDRHVRQADVAPANASLLVSRKRSSLDRADDTGEDFSFESTRAAAAILEVPVNCSLLTADQTETTPIPATSRSGSDGTRTRDLRRDRPAL